MFKKKTATFRQRNAIIVTGLGSFDLSDTLECGQAFRYECTYRDGGYIEYITVIGELLLRIGQRERGELIVFEVTDEEFESTVRPYFALDTDYEAIREEVKSRTDSEWLRRAADSARGVVILKQNPWETLFSFIISQNNNIPRIRKIIKTVCAEYGKNLARCKGSLSCPLGGEVPSEDTCRACGICYTFPTASQILERPEGLLPSHPGFRYKYLVDAAEKVAEGEIDLEKIREMKSYAHSVENLTKIKGVGEKVASCTALFGLGNLDAFPIDVWMKRAIDTYFDGHLDHKALGEFAGVAQQYIFHYIRNLEKADKM